MLASFETGFGSFHAEAAETRGARRGPTNLVS